MKRNTTKPATASYGRSTALGPGRELPWLAECHLRHPEPTKRRNSGAGFPDQAFGSCGCHWTQVIPGTRNQSHRRMKKPAKEKVGGLAKGHLVQKTARTCTQRISAARLRATRPQSTHPCANTCTSMPSRLGMGLTKKSDATFLTSLNCASHRKPIDRVVVGLAGLSPRN